jgi:uncharacterized protein YigA (DUF484 family)
MLKFAADRRLDLLEVPLDLRREVVAELRQRIDELLQLGALNNREFNKVIDFGLRVDHKRLFADFWVLSRKEIVSCPWG